MRVPPFELPLDEIRETLDELRRPMRVAVMRAKNPFNIGTIIRVAHSFLAAEIWLVGDEPFYKKAAMGMQRYENLVFLPDEDAFLEKARNDGLPVVAFEREHAQGGLWDVELPRSCVLLFGSEDDGLPPSLIEAADQVVAIPMFGINNSFPVSVAAGIGMAEWTRRHGPTFTS